MHLAVVFTSGFFENLQEDINDFECKNIILCGDFNVGLNQNLDLKNYSDAYYKQKTREKVLHFMKDNNLVDIFRKKNPNEKSFTWTSNKDKTQQGRLDFFLISENLCSYCTDCCIVPSLKSDHSMITLSINDEGLNLWGFDNSLLLDEKFVKLIKDVLQHVQKQYSHPSNGSKVRKLTVNNDQQILEILLEQIKQSCISYSTKNENYMKNSKTLNEGRIGVKEGESGNILSRIIPCIKLKNGHFISEQSDVLQKTKEYYEKLYRKVDNSVEDEDNLQKYFSKEEEKDVADDEDEYSSSLELVPMTFKEEAKETMDRMISTGSPGSDGFTLEFFKFFWENLGDFVDRSIRYAFDCKMLSTTQRHGLISCLPKEDKPKHF